MVDPIYTCQRISTKGQKAVISHITRRSTTEKSKKSFYPTKEKNYTEIAIKYFQRSILKVYAKAKGFLSFSANNSDYLLTSSMSIQL